MNGDLSVPSAVVAYKFRITLLESLCILRAGSLLSGSTAEKNVMGAKSERNCTLRGFQPMSWCRIKGAMSLGRHKLM